MVNLQRPKSKKDFKRILFSKKRGILRPLWYQITEALIMLFSGISILTFLNWLPQRLDLLASINDSLKETVSGLIQLFDALVNLGTALIIIALIFFGFLLLLGGIWRILRLPTRVSLNRKKSYTPISRSRIKN